MGNLVPENVCAEVDIPSDEYQFSNFGIETNIEWAYLIWFFVFIPALFVSYAIVRCMGKISANFCCVPWVNKETEVKENEHYDFVHWRGIVIKMKTIIKAITISGLVTTVINTLILMGEYPACSGYEDVGSTILISWVISIFIYFWVWRLDFCYSVATISIFRRFIWFVGEKLIILVCGASFVRVIFVSEEVVGSGVYCYCGDESLNLINVIYTVFGAVFGIIATIQALNQAGFIKENACCEVQSKAPTGKLGVTCVKSVKVCAGCCAKLSTCCMLVCLPIIILIIVPGVLLFVRFQLIADKWSERIDELDVSDVVLIWMIAVSLAFVFILLGQKIKRKIKPPKTIEEIELEIEQKKQEKQAEKEKQEAEKEEKKRVRRETKELIAQQKKQEKEEEQLAKAEEKRIRKETMEMEKQEEKEEKQKEKEDKQKEKEIQKQKEKEDKKREKELKKQREEEEEDKEMQLQREKEDKERTETVIVFDK